MKIGHTSRLGAALSGAVCLTFLGSTTALSAQLCPIQTHKLLAPDGATEDQFGWSVAISGSTAIVGARWSDENGANSGCAYAFDTTTGEQIAKFLPDDGSHQFAVAGPQRFPQHESESQPSTQSGTVGGARVIRATQYRPQCVSERKPGTQWRTHSGTHRVRIAD